jgi:hypothetical protein
MAGTTRQMKPKPLHQPFAMPVKKYNFFENSGKKQ